MLTAEGWRDEWSVTYHLGVYRFLSWGKDRLCDA